MKGNYSLSRIILLKGEFTLNNVKEYVGQYRFVLPFFPPNIRKDTEGVYDILHCDVDITVEWLKKDSPFVSVLITTKEEAQSPQNSMEFVTTVIYKEYLKKIVGHFRATPLKPSDVIWELQEVSYKRDRYKLELLWDESKKEFVNTKFL